jgi:coatomer subunit beta
MALAVERSCSMIVAMDKPATAGEIKAALEGSDDAEKTRMLKKAIAMSLAGEQLPALFICIIRDVLSSKDKTVQRLLLYYLVRTIAYAASSLLGRLQGLSSCRCRRLSRKRTRRGSCCLRWCGPTFQCCASPAVALHLIARCLQILICQNLRNNLIHPNEYLRGVTLRFLCRIREEDILEPLVPAILQNLEHRHSFVRRNAVLCLNELYKLPKGELMFQDAPEMIATFLGNEQDVSARRNALMFLTNHDPDRAIAFLSAHADKLIDWGAILQMAVVELIRKVSQPLCHSAPELYAPLDVSSSLASPKRTVLAGLSHEAC